jgi:hypothetical protein
MTEQVADKLDREEVKKTGVPVDVDQAPEPEAPSNQNGKAQEDVLDVLQPKAEQKQWTFGPEGMRQTYVQKPLSFIGKMQWFALVGEVLDKAMGGENPLTVGNLLSGPGMRGGRALSANDFRDADTFVHAVGKLVYYAPEFLLDSFCIWLNVPAHERDMVKVLMDAPPEEGGLSDDAGLEIIERFIDQNYDAIDSFFRDKLGLLQKRVSQRMEDRRKRSQQSKP